MNWSPSSKADRRAEKSVSRAIKLTILYIKTQRRKNFSLDEINQEGETLQKREWSRLIKSVEIQFVEAKISDKYSWTTRKASERNKTIFINRYFLRQLCKRNLRSPEKKRLVFLISVCLFHEVAHLTFRWKGQRQTPSKFVEAGDYSENSAFGGLIRMVVSKNRKNPCCGVILRRHEGYYRIKQEYMNRLVQKTELNMLDLHPEVFKSQYDPPPGKKVLKRRQTNRKTGAGFGRNAKILGNLCGITKT
mmetsp:Transcript_21481/g.28203  ORF Transcript_21481/g.28203 Transcript_21481/m.28203 type:complete len:248 (+) Transcript_21481:3-746(+)